MVTEIKAKLPAKPTREERHSFQRWLDRKLIGGTLPADAIYVAVDTQTGQIPGKRLKTCEATMRQLGRPGIKVYKLHLVDIPPRTG